MDKNISLSKNQTKKAIQRNKRAEREMNRIVEEPFVAKVFEVLEERRRELKKNYRIYTQEYVAEKAGISRSTYKGYVMETSYHIDLITAKGIADILGCQLSDVIKEAEHRLSVEKWAND